MTDSDDQRAGRRYRVGDLIVDAVNRAFERDGNVTTLPKLSFNLLHCLIRHAPDTVDIDQLSQEVWGQAFVSPETVTQRVKLLRDALGDDHQNPRFIETKRGHGYRLIPPVEPLAHSGQEPVRRRRLMLASIALVVVVLGLVYNQDVGRMDEPGDVPQSIAVLPLVNMSSDPDQDYFSDGLSEELLHLLTRVPGLHVAARTSSFAFKGEKIDVPTIAKRLHVSYVLEGSVRKSGEDIRITVQLIKADDGYHLWSETYDRTLEDVFAVQGEIAASVVSALKVTLLDGALAVPETSPNAYAAYLRARYFDNLKGKENWEKAVASYQQALAIDPNYAPAWVGLSVIYRYQAGNRLRDFDEGMALARDAVGRALALDGSLAIGWASLGQIEMFDAWDWTTAGRAIEKALQLEPGNSDVLNNAAGLASVLARLDEAIALFQRAVALDPLSQSSQNGLGLAYMNAGRFVEAESVFRQLVELNPQYPWGYVNLGRLKLLKGEPEAALADFERSAAGLWRDAGTALALADLGRSDEAQAALARLENDYAETGAFQIAAVHAWRGDIDLAFEWLQRSYQSRESGLIFLSIDLFYANLHDDPRWPALLERMQLPH